MIRATTGRQPRVRKSDTTKVRPSSASGKLQSHAYLDLTARSNTPSNRSAVKTNESLQKPSKSHLGRRLTLCVFDGIGENAEAFTRLNTPASSMGKIKIEENITLEQLHQIKTAFTEADTDGSGTLDIEEFKMVVKNSLGVKGRHEEQINSLFMKIDSSSDGEIDWDEFCTYMQLEYSEKEEATLRSKRTSFVLPATSVTTPHHKAPVLRTLCLPDSYLCAGQDGLLSFWSHDLKLKKTKSILECSAVERQAFIMKPTIWVTDVAVMSGSGKLLIGTGERELHFYELMTFEFYCQIIGLDAVPLKIDFNQITEEEGIIVYGDDQGCVSIMMFQSITETLRCWKKVPRVNGVPTVTMHDVANGNGTSFIKWKVHNDWITEIRYFHSLRSVISSSNNAATALVRGCTTASTVLDHLKETTGPSVTPHTVASHNTSSPGNKEKNRKSLLAQQRQKTDQSVFYVYKGVKTFDFSKQHNIVATGGMDRILRLWNPYVPHKPTGLLRGHASPIIYIAISEEDRRIFSISTDKCVKVWDVVEQNCLVTVNPKMHKIKGEIMACIYSQQQRALVITTDHISVLGISRRETEALPHALSLKMRIKVVDEISVTHTEPVTCCAYNPSFGHVITCSEGSVVKLWDFESGTFMFEFNKAHHDTAITSITFDSTGRRLITSGRDGAVRIWNYNNGHCLKSLEQENCSKEVSDKEVSDNEVSDCVYVEINNNRFIIAVGWDQRINIFSDDTNDFHLVQHPHPHWPDDLRRGHTDDIVAVTFGRPNMLATVSYDGCIIVWNVISGHSISRIPYPNIETDSESSNDDCDKTDQEKEKASVNKLAFLENRFLDKLNATLIAGCSDGTAIFWNIKQVKAHARWRATQRKSGLSSMVLTGDCQLLYVGDTLGFISIWDVETYALRPVGKISADTNCPKWSTPPAQIATWRCHVQPITCIGVIQSHELVITSSVDYTARLWTNTGQFIGTYGQSNPWDIYDPDTWQHPMVPPEVLLDPKSLPEHPVIDGKYCIRQLIDSDNSDSESDTELPELASKRGKQPIKRRSPRKSSGSWSGSGNDAWNRRLSRRLSRSSLLTNINMYKDEEQQMLEDVRKSMRKSAGKRLRHEKLMAQQRHLQLDPSSHAFQSLHYFDLAHPPADITKPDPRSHIDDVFLIPEEEEVDT